jgi:hypothetical protein
MFAGFVKELFQFEPDDLDARRDTLMVIWGKGGEKTVVICREWRSVSRRR